MYFFINFESELNDEVRTFLTVLINTLYTSVTQEFLSVFKCALLLFEYTFKSITIPEYCPVLNTMYIFIEFVLTSHQNFQLNQILSKTHINDIPWKSALLLISK